MLSKLSFIAPLISSLKTKKKPLAMPVTRKSIYAQALERGEVPPIESLINKDKASVNPEPNKSFVRPEPAAAVTRKSIYAQALERGEVPSMKNSIDNDEPETSEDLTNCA